MALTFARWLLAAVAGCAIVVALVLDSDPSSRGQPLNPTLDGLARRQSRAHTHVALAAERLRVLQLRDSLAPLAEHAGADAVLIDAALSPSYRQAIGELLVKRDRERVGGAVSPAATAFVLDSLSAVRGVPRWGVPTASGVDFILPERAGQSCLTLVRVNPARFIVATPAEFASDTRLARLFGPCEFYQSFGPPGPGIAPWLTARGWSLAQAGSWRRPVERWSPRSFYGLAPLLDRDDQLSLALRDFTSFSGATCIAGGDAAACRHAVVDAAPDGETPVWGAIVSPRAGEELYGGYPLGPKRVLGPREISYLNDMVHALGPEKFARFWRSSRAPADAFRDASGEDLGAWTLEWARQAYGKRGSGPYAPPASIVFALVIVIVAGATAARATARRQVA